MYSSEHRINVGAGHTFVLDVLFSGSDSVFFILPSCCKSSPGSNGSRALAKLWFLVSTVN